MSQTGYTPIQIYSSSTAANVPLAASLTNSTLGSELAINITDGKLFYKDNSNVVQVIGWKVTPTTAGGTGLTSYAAGDMLYYASGTALSKLTIGSADYVMTSSGTTPQWSQFVKAISGGTGQTSYAVGDILYANTTTTLAKLADVATGNALISGGVGVAPSWGKIELTTHISGTLPIANGGTNGTATPTAGAVPYGTGTAYAFTAAGTANYLLQSNGASAPTWVNSISLADSNGTSSFNSSGVYIGQGTAFTSGASEIYTIGTRQFNVGTSGNATYNIFTNSTLAASFDSSQFATFVNQSLRTISVGTIAGSGSATITLKANPGGTKYYGFDVFVTGYENTNGGTIYMKAQVICNWASGTINQRGIGSTNFNESLGVGDYRAYGGASLSIGASSNNLTLTITNSGGSSMTSVVVTVQDHFS